MFRSFWLEHRQAGADAVVVHALMDSPSVSGAFRFPIHPGEETRFDVQARLYPRVELAHAGIAALTSMYSVRRQRPRRRGRLPPRGARLRRPGAVDRRRRADLAAVAESAGVQDSGFEDSNPRGFGLMQRQRDFADYADDEARITSAGPACGSSRWATGAKGGVP